MNLEGKILGNRYEIIKKIGTGGMAVVYKAKCQMLNRNVAIKVLKEEFTTDEEFVNRFKIEAQSAASLSHPNIVSIYDVGQEGRIHYIVMELVEGKTLKDIIREDGALSWKWSVNVVAQIASALEVAHKNHIIHRDIKPHNIIITEDGIAKVTDFGIAKAVSNSTITAFGTTIGSVHYFSPEHARGGFTDEKSDIYSLGVVLYELITGKVPFDSDTPVSIALKHMQDEPIAPMEINPSIPKCVNDIVLKSMQKDSNLRYSSATLMLVDLQFSLKNPDLDFVKIGEMPVGDETQVLSKLDVNAMQSRKKQEETRNSKSSKREEKKGIVELFKRSKSFRITTYIIGLIILFAIALGGTYFALGGAAKDVEVPNVIGKSKAEAESILKDKKLIVEYEEEVYDDTIPSGYVISQDPESPIKRKEKEGIVRLTISKGTKVVTLPDVSNKNYEEAKSELEKLGLVVEEKREFSVKIDKDTVIRQTPEANKEVEGGSTVILYVSDGEEKIQVTMPELVGKSEEEAKKLLSDNKLLLKSPIEYIQDESKADGEVIRQSIVAGNIIEQMTTISITVNKLPKASKGVVVIDLSKYAKLSTPNEGEEGEEETPKQEKSINVKVEVDGKSIYNKSHKSSEGKISVPVEGFGTIYVKVYIDGDIKADRSMNLDNVTKLEI